MTNEEKANEIARDMLPYNNAEYHACYNSAMKAMQWKDEQWKCLMAESKSIGVDLLQRKEEQHKQEKKQWIDEACEWWENELTYPTMTQEEIKWCQTLIAQFEKAMKGE